VSTTFQPPAYLSEAEKARWNELSAKYGVPVYKSPFWFWDAELPYGAAADRVRCNAFAFPSSNDIVACAVWNDKQVADLGVMNFSAAPPYLEDHNATSGPSDMVVVPNSPPISPELLARLLEAAERKRQKNESSIPVMLMFGCVGAAILYAVYKHK
jgi:hypothetical protein